MLKYQVNFKQEQVYYTVQRALLPEDIRNESNEK